MRLLLASALAAAGASAAALKAGGDPMPAFDAVRWYNTPALTNADLEGKAVLIDVFRTW
jgi:hypothetical protein